MTHDIAKIDNYTVVIKKIYNDVYFSDSQKMHLLMRQLEPISRCFE